jgi:hypothetical protein
MLATQDEWRGEPVLISTSKTSKTRVDAIGEGLGLDNRQGLPPVEPTTQQIMVIRVPSVARRGPTLRS